MGHYEGEYYVETLEELEEQLRKMKQERIDTKKALKECTDDLKRFRAANKERDPSTISEEEKEFIELYTADRNETGYALDMELDKLDDCIRSTQSEIFNKKYPGRMG